MYAIADLHTAWITASPITCLMIIPIQMMERYFQSDIVSKQTVMINNSLSNGPLEIFFPFIQKGNENVNAEFIGRLTNLRI